MKAKVYKLTSGRWMMTFAAMAAALLIAGIVSFGWLQMALLAIASGAFAISVLGFLASWKVESTTTRAANRDLSDRLRALESDMSSLSGRVEFFGLADSGTEAQWPASTSSIFSPQVITSSTVLGKPDAHHAGRIAANQRMSTDSLVKMSQIANANTARRSRKVSWLGSLMGAETEAEGWEISPVQPGISIGIPNPASAYLVVNLAGTEFTPWDYLTESLSYTSLQSTTEYIQKSKDLGTVIVVCRAEVPSHFASTVESYSDLLLDAHGAPVSESDFLGLPINELVSGILNKQGEHGV